jgi:hypothetical protein
MGSHISITLAEIYLQFFEELIVKYWKATGEITYYIRYVDNIIIISDQNKINQDSITNYINSIHKYFEFKLTEEENQNINYLDLSIHRNNNNRQLGIYRKPTQRDTTIHFTTDHPLEHKLAAYNFNINRMLSTPITEQARKQERNTICNIAGNSITDYPQFKEQNNQETKNKKTPTQKQRKK